MAASKEKFKILIGSPDNVEAEMNRILESGVTVTEYEVTMQHDKDIIISFFYEGDIEQPVDETEIVPETKKKK